MKNTSRPHVVIIGGGFGGVQTFRNLHRFIHHKRGAHVTLIDQRNYFLFYPMLHEMATGTVSRTHLTQPIREMLHCCHARFMRATVKKVDRKRRIIHTDDGPVRYDYCVVAVGSRPNDFGVPGVAEHAFALRSVEDCARLRNRIIYCFEEASREHREGRRAIWLSFVIVGGGPTGVELAGQLGDLINREMRALYPLAFDHVAPRITIVESAERILGRHSDYFTNQAGRALKKMGVEIMVNTRVTKVEKDKIHLANNDHIGACTVIWTSGVQSNADQIFTAAELDERSRIPVDAYLRMKDDPRVFALGDAATIHDPGLGFVPQTAQAAVHESRTLAQNIKRTVLGRVLAPYRYHSPGDLVPIGDWFAIAQLGPVRFTGRIAWLLRRLVFLFTMYDWGDRARIALDWTLNMFTFRDTSEL